MVSNEAEYRLGIDGYPAEGGLYESILRKTGLHVHDGADYKFQQPTYSEPCHLRHAWEAASHFLKNNADRAVPLSEILDLWEAPPIGMKRGVMPVLVTAYILSAKDDLAIYREGLFQPAFTELDTDYLAKDPGSIQVRWVDLSQMPAHLLSGLSNIVSALAKTPRGKLTPLEVARGIIAIFDELPNWTKRTQQVSDQAKTVRNILKNAHDPNQLLFTDLPSLCNTKNPSSREAVDQVVDLVNGTLTELAGHYPKMLQSLEELMLEELNVQPGCQESLATLQERAKTIKQLSGDFRVDAFINRLTTYKGSASEIEGVGSLAANKPPRDWVDTDLDRARLEIVAFTESFKRTEIYSRVKGSKNGTAISITVGREKDNEPLYAEIAINNNDQPSVDRLIKELEEAIKTSDIKNNSIVLAALSKISAHKIEKMISQERATEDPANEPS